MNSSFHRKDSGFTGWAARGAAICIVATLWGCAGQPVEQGTCPKGAEGVVAERAQARWNAVVTDRLSEAYQYLSPSSREVTRYEDYIRSVRVGFYKAAKVDKVMCSTDESCVVHITVDYMVKGSRIQSPLRETWVRKDGNWWYIRGG